MTVAAQSAAVIDRSFGTIVFRRDEDEPRILVVWEAWGNGHWGLPKGHPQTNEEPLQTALRELSEEVGIVPDVVLSEPPISHEYHFLYRGWKILRQIEYYFVEVVAGTDAAALQTEEVRESRWVTCQEFMAMTPYRELREVVQHAFRTISAAQH